MTLEIGPYSLLWPTLISGSALGLIFVPLSGTALGMLPPEKLGNGSAMFNLIGTDSLCDSACFASGDVRLADVELRHLHAAAHSLGRGGVGYYPDSNFVHLDVGPVRSWSGT